MFGQHPHNERWGGLRTEHEPVPTSEVVAKAGAFLTKLYEGAFNYPSTCIKRVPYTTITRSDWSFRAPPEGVVPVAHPSTASVTFDTKRYFIDETTDIDSYVLVKRTIREEFRIIDHEDEPDKPQPHLFWFLEEARPVSANGKLGILIVIRTYVGFDEACRNLLRSLPVAALDDIMPRAAEESDEEE